MEEYDKVGEGDTEEHPEEVDPHVLYEGTSAGEYLYRLVDKSYKKADNQRQHRTFYLLAPCFGVHKAGIHEYTEHKTRYGVLTEMRQLADELLCQCDGDIQEIKYGLEYPHNVCALLGGVVCGNDRMSPYKRENKYDKYYEDTFFQIIASEK